MIELLEECLRIQSLSGQEAEVARFLCTQMAARGLRSAIDSAGNVVGMLGTGSRQAVLLGHMDTVDGMIPVRYENGALYGRGSVDAKGPLCAFILAAAQLAPLALENWQIIIVGATEEEAATSRGARYAATQYRPEFCIIGEPSGADGITLGYKGRLLVDAHFEQPSRHTAARGASASEQTVRLWNRVDEFARQFNSDKLKAFDQILPSLRRIVSGEDGLREWCDMTISLRLPAELGPHQMQQHFEHWAGNMSDAQPVLHFSGPEQAYRSSKDTGVARAFVDAIRTEGQRPVFKLKTGTADFNVVGPVWQCPMVAYGPGDSALDHTPDEHVTVVEFERSVRVLTNVLRDMLGA